MFACVEIFSMSEVFACGKKGDIFVDVLFHVIFIILRVDSLF